MKALLKALLEDRGDLKDFKKPPSLFEPSLRLSYEPKVGWQVERLGLFKRIYYLILSIFYNDPLASDNRRTLQAYRACLAPTDYSSRRVQRLFQSLDLPFPSLARSPSAPASLYDSSLPRKMVEERAPLRLGPSPRLKGISNQSAINCWLNASVQILFQSKFFRGALFGQLTQGALEEEAAFEKRMGVIGSLKHLYLGYVDPFASPDLLFQRVNALKRSLSLLAPSSFCGASLNDKLKSQQCASTAIGTILRALKIDDHRMVEGCPLILLENPLSFEEGLIHHFCSLSEPRAEGKVALLNPIISPPPFIAVQTLLYSSQSDETTLTPPTERSPWKSPSILSLKGLLPEGSPLSGLSYRLVGVIQHEGDSPHAGHWYALIEKGGSFTKVNDAFLSNQEVAFSYNAILFYELLAPPEQALQKGGTEKGQKTEGEDGRKEEERPS